MNISYKNVHQNNFHECIYRKGTGEERYGSEKETNAEMPDLKK